MTRLQKWCLVFVAAFSQAAKQDSTNTTAVRDWESRLLADDPKVRATAEDQLVQGSARSLPVVKQFLDRSDPDLLVVSFKILQRIGPPAIPTLVSLLRHESVDIRQRAVSELVDLAPHTEAVQPALRQALRDDDVVVEVRYPGPAPSLDELHVFERGPTKLDASLVELAIARRIITDSGGEVAPAAGCITVRLPIVTT